MRKLFLISAMAMLAFPTTTFAQVIIHGDGAPRQCYVSVKLGDPGRPSTIRSCVEALKTPGLNKKNLAAMNTNIGILHMRAGNLDQAKEWYDNSLEIAPNIAETYVNYSAALIHLNDPRKAIEMASKALEFETDKRPEALYNRAIAYDRIDDYNRAYRDLKQALTLRPEWPAALKAIDNYIVAPKPTG